MNYRHYITVLVAFVLCVGCKEKDQEKEKEKGNEINLVTGTVYRLTTTEGDGFAKFERLSDGQWSGVYYLNEGRLMADARKVGLTSKKGKLSLTEITGDTIPVLSHSRYEAPEFKDYPETWTYEDSAYAVSVKKDVVYAKAEGYWISYPDTGGTINEIFKVKKKELKRGKTELKLTMDVYLPKDNKSASRRPLLVLVHGGAFFNGDKRDPGFPEFARYFAGRGYVVASVNYRLGFRKSIPSVNRAGFRAIQDVDAAIRYLVHKKDYAVDPNRVFVAGTSAGGITALNVAFMKEENIPNDADEEGGIKAVSPELKDTYTVLGVGNLWGAVNDLSILNNATTSVISFQSTGDRVVPYGEGHPFKNVFLNWLVFPKMYGSEKITEYLGAGRASLKSYDLPGRHTIHTDEDEKGNTILSPRFYEMESGMCQFFSNLMSPPPVVPEHTGLTQTFQVTSSDIESVYWQVQGGVILEQSGCSAKVLLFSDAPSYSVTVCGTYKSGETFRHTWTL